MTTAILLLEESEVERSSRVLGCIHVTEGNKKRSLPLTSVQIAARVADRLAHVTVTETFKNPYSDHLEAVYIFPLAGGSAVSSFKMKVGERLVVGKVDERQAARDQYVEALQEGKRAALLEQERDDVFTVQVGNLPPGEEVQVEITYSEKLAYFDNGTTEIRLPLVVAPRYIPGNAVARQNLGDGVELDTDIVPDASRISPPRLAPGVDPKTALNLTVELAGDQVIEDLSCSQHATKIGTSKDGFKISLAREDELLDRDFVLRWRVATESVQSNFLVYQNPANKSECYGMISLLPPKTDEAGALPRDVIFVVDRSGSMSGVKMASAARACSLLINTLGPRDRFAIQAFDDVVEWMNGFSTKKQLVYADEGGKELGEKYLRTVGARGGTEMHNAMREAINTMKLRLPCSMRLPVIVVLTDGEVGNESPILKHIQSELGDIRVFTVGVDTAVNDGFLNRLAALGGGTSTFVQPGAQLEEALGGIGREIGTPVITNLSLEDANCGLDKNSVTPARVPDLFEGRASSAFFKMSAGKLKELQSGKIKVKGLCADGSKFAQEVSARVVDLPALAQLWAKSHIIDLEDTYRISNDQQQMALHKQIVDIAIAHSILTKFTAFVLVDHAEIVNAGGAVRTVVQPVQTPAGWDSLGVSAPMTNRSLKARTISTGSWGAAPACWGSPAAGAGGAGSMYDGQSPLREKIAGDSSDAWGAATGAAASSTWSTPQQMPKAAPQAPQSPAPPAGAAPCGSPGGSPPSPAQSSNLPTRPASSLMGQLVRQSSEGVREKQKDSASAQLSKEFQNAFRTFETNLRALFAAIKNGDAFDAQKLVEARMQLLQALSNYVIADRLPILQKFVRADALQLIHAIQSAKTITPSIKKVGAEGEANFEKVVEEVNSMQKVPKPFWQNNV